MPLNQWKQSLELLKKADVAFKMGGQSDRGFGLIKSFASQMSDSEDDNMKQAASDIFKTLLPMYFEDDVSVMHFDMIEIYSKHLGRMKDWKELILLKRRLIK